MGIHYFEVRRELIVGPEGVQITSILIRGHPLSMYAKFSEKLTFITP